MRHLLGIGGPQLVVGSIVRVSTKCYSRHAAMPAGTLGIVMHVDDLGPFITPIGTDTKNQDDTVYPPGSDCHIVWVD